MGLSELLPEGRANDACGSFVPTDSGHYAMDLQAQKGLDGTAYVVLLGHRLSRLALSPPKHCFSPRW